MPKLDDSDFQAILSGLIEEAEGYTDDEISGKRALATEFYKGNVDIEAEKGRSKAVSKDVRDTIMSQMPSVMRVFFSSDKAVEYSPTGPEDEAIAEQATDYANYIVNQENDGYKIMYAAFKDALIRGCGVVKIWWHEKEESITQRYTGLDEATLQLIQTEQDTDIEVLGVTFDQSPTIDQMTGQQIIQQVPSYEVKVTKRLKKGTICLSEVPGEEIIVARMDKELGESYVGHRAYMTVSELVAMGYDLDLIESSLSTNEFASNQENEARSNFAMYESTYTTNNPSMRKALYIESYCKIDRNGDGIAELLKVCTIGDGYTIVNVEEVDDHPFVAFTCDPEPHLSPFESSSPADDVMDIMRLKTAIWRNTLDSAAGSIYPRMVIVEGKVSHSDVLNNDIGAPIRAKSLDSIMPLVTPDLSATGLNMLAYADEIKEARTGMSKAAMGLDADALRSTASNAANAVVTATQSRLELLTRNLANGYKELFRKLLILICKHQDKPKTVRLRNEWVSIDPRSWNANMDVSIGVALGTGTNAEKFNILAGIAQKQEMIIQTMGPSNPLVSLSQYGNTLAKMIELGGFKNTNAFVSELPDDFQLPPPPPQVDPQAQVAEMLAQVEREKTQAKMQIDQAKLNADMQIKAAKLELDREQMQADFARQKLELEMQAAKLQAEIKIKEAQLVMQQLTHMQQAQQNAEKRQEESEAKAQEMLSNQIAGMSALIDQQQPNGENDG